MDFLRLSGRLVAVHLSNKAIRAEATIRDSGRTAQRSPHNICILTLRRFRTLRCLPDDRPVIRRILAEGRALCWLRALGKWGLPAAGPAVTAQRAESTCRLRRSETDWRTWPSSTNGGRLRVKQLTADPETIGQLQTAHKIEVTELGPNIPHHVPWR
jgi:hypothetical protein